MFIAFDQLFQLASADEVAVPGADDEAACPLGGLAGLHGTVLAPTFESLLLSAFDPAPHFFVVSVEVKGAKIHPNFLVANFFGVLWFLSGFVGGLCF